MTIEYFVKKESVVREIWGKADTILFIFAGASAEFALNKAVDWLYFTGRLPADPLARLFSTVSYARKIVFSEKQAALFFNFKIKNFRAYIMGDQLQQFFTRNTITAPGYSLQDAMLRFGFNWVMIN